MTLKQSLPAIYHQTKHRISIPGVKQYPRFLGVGRKSIRQEAPRQPCLVQHARLLGHHAFAMHPVSVLPAYSDFTTTIACSGALPTKAVFICIASICPCKVFGSAPQALPVSVNPHVTACSERLRTFIISLIYFIVIFL